MKRLQALTVCVHYADLLRCILPNRAHFDRWLIVTHESDVETIAFCEREGLEILCSQRLYQDGAPFDKARALNEGLDALDQEGWVAVLDSDILLPGDFRERLDSQRLNWRSLYGLLGRQACDSYEAYARLRDCQPWNALWFSRSVLGYVHLFHFSQPRNRYPEGKSNDASAYDMAFSDSFPEHLRRKLPIPCLHLGPVRENWKGRKSRQFIARSRGAGASSQAGDSSACVQDLLDSLAETDLAGGTVLQLGYQDPRTTVALAARFDRVLLVDAWGLPAPTAVRHRSPVSAVPASPARSASSWRRYEQWRNCAIAARHRFHHDVPDYILGRRHEN